LKFGKKMIPKKLVFFLQKHIPLACNDKMMGRKQMSRLTVALKSKKN
jgi:hypothetical protein